MVNVKRNYWQEDITAKPKFNEYFTMIGTELTKDIPTITEKRNDYLDGICKKSNVLAPTTTDEIRIIPCCV